MTMTLPPTTTTPKTTGTTGTTTTTLTAPTPEQQCCPNCGLTLPAPTSEPHAALLQAQRQIEDLESQVRLLSQKATAAVDRWADYEDELSRLRAASTSTNATTTTSTKNNSNTNNGSSSSVRPHTPDPSVSTSSPRSSFLGAGAASRISQLLSPRKSAAAAAATAAAAAATTSTGPSTTNTSKALHQIQRGSLSSSALPLGSRDLADSAAETRELLTALTHERRLRAAAEEKLAATSREVEDLSASLFEQANTMVATERRARAALEERVSELGQRDQDKKVRIGRLEGAILRIERAREVLEEGKKEKEDGGEEREGKTGEGEEKESRDGRGRYGKETGGNAKEEG
ncbi:hypothetical protein FHL15_011176 [Xylaria flabelliformis]|uniref:GDP/GTP exchange factor Sec2 N-terminal domain-containing protein n=1 Tax=Xylaria flabelliformis TaxID=2512241 RepID=A0A553HIZ1_9PEZI|nr:hypothetical protein FHL15_011176 [Xylaria flabelliformis]